MSTKVNSVTDSSFEEDVLKSDIPVLVDFWAEWCGPCKMIAPILEEIHDEFQGKLKILKLNIDDNADIPPKYGIRGIPTLMLFKNGQPEATKVGQLSKVQLTEFLEENIESIQAGNIVWIDWDSFFHKYISLLKKEQKEFREEIYTLIKQDYRPLWGDGDSFFELIHLLDESAL